MARYKRFALNLLLLLMPGVSAFSENKKQTAPKKNNGGVPAPSQNTVKEVGTSDWTLETATTRLWLTIQNHHPAIKEFKSTVYAYNYTKVISEIPLMKTVTDRGGTVYTLKWKYKKAILNDENTSVILVFTNRNPALEMKSIWKAERGRGPVEHSLEIINHSGETLTITQQESMGVTLQNEVDPTIWRFAKESGEAEGTMGRSGTGVYREVLTVDETVLAWTSMQNNWNGNGFIPMLYSDYGEYGFYLGW